MHVMMQKKIIRTYGKPLANQQDREAATGTKTSIHGEPEYMGKPLSYWLRSIRNRDSETELAFEAIRSLGPDAQPAVPKLTEIVDEPFTPIRIGVDTHASVLSKVSEIEFRADRCPSRR